MANMFALEPLGQAWTEADQAQDAQDKSELSSGPLHLATSLHAVPSLYEGIKISFHFLKYFQA